MTRIEAQRSKQPGAQRSGREGVRSVGSSLGSCLSLLLCSNMLPGSSRTGLGFTSCSPRRRAITVAIPESNQRERKCRGSGPYPIGRISCWITERRWPHKQSPEGRPAALGICLFPELMHLSRGFPRCTEGILERGRDMHSVTRRSE